MNRILPILLLIAGTAVGQQPGARPDTPAPVPGPSNAPPVRGQAQAPIESIAELHNVMSQPLHGIGIVTGLNNTGSTEKATRQALTNLIRREGLTIAESDVTSGAVALVSVNGTLEPFMHEGERFSVKVSTLGDADSLFGGQLIWAELRAVDGRVYAIAEGPVSANGTGASGPQASLSINHPTTGWIEHGGMLVEELEYSHFSAAGDIELRLRRPGAANAAAVATGAEAALEDLGLQVRVVDPRLVRIEVPEDMRTSEHANAILARVWHERVPVTTPHKVIIDQATGLVVAGGGVQISPCVVSMSNLTISVVNEEEVSQPFPGINQGTTERVGRTRIEITEEASEPQRLGSDDEATVDDLVANLRALTLTPRQIAAVFRALDAEHYLQGRLVVR